MTSLHERLRPDWWGHTLTQIRVIQVLLGACHWRAAWVRLIRTNQRVVPPGILLEVIQMAVNIVLIREIYWVLPHILVQLLLLVLTQLLLRLLLLWLEDSSLNKGLSRVRMLPTFVGSTSNLPLSTRSPVICPALIRSDGLVGTIGLLLLKFRVIKVISLLVLIELLKLNPVDLLPCSVTLGCIDRLRMLFIWSIELPFERVSGSLWSCSKVGLLIIGVGCICDHCF